MSVPMWVDIEWRHDLGVWLNGRGLTGEMAEIGVACGGFARQVLEHWKGVLYHMVDLWEPQAADVYREKTEGIDYNSYYQECLNITASNSIVRMHKGNSVNLAREFQDGSMDCVYIDANHAFAHVWDDMEAWWPKVKLGGVFSGHDYGNDINFPHYCQVKAAVDKWATEHRLTFTYSRCGSWWILK
jgi:hypothetical protein